MNVLAHERGVTLKAARREDRRFLGRRTETNVACRTHERVRETAWLEPLADRAGVPGLVLDDRRPERLEPFDPLVEALPDDALQTLVSGRAFGTEVVPLAKAPDDAAREQH